MKPIIIIDKYIPGAKPMVLLEVFPDGSGVAVGTDRTLYLIGDVSSYKLVRANDDWPSSVTVTMGWRGKP